MVELDECVVPEPTPDPALEVDELSAHLIAALNTEDHISAALKCKMIRNREELLPNTVQEITREAAVVVTRVQTAANGAEAEEASDQEVEALDESPAEETTTDGARESMGEEPEVSTSNETRLEDCSVASPFILNKVGHGLCIAHPGVVCKLGLGDRSV